MAKLSTLKQDHAAITEGEWIRVGDEYDDLEILTRGITDLYLDAQAAKQRRAAVGFGGDVDRLPVAIRRKINVDCLIAHVVLDVRNLTDDAGQPINFTQFKELLHDRDYTPLVSACFLAASQVGRRTAADLEEASGN